MFLSGQWGTLCGYGADYTTARVACRLLGYDYNANGNQCILTLIVNHIEFNVSMNSSTDVTSIVLLTDRYDFSLPFFSTFPFSEYTLFTIFRHEIRRY